MKKHKFLDPDNEGYEIIIPDNVVKDIVRDYLQKTYYWSVSILCFIVGFLFGTIIK